MHWCDLFCTSQAGILCLSYMSISTELFFMSLDLEIIIQQPNLHCHLLFLSTKFQRKRDLFRTSLLDDCITCSSMLVKSHYLAGKSHLFCCLVFTNFFRHSKHADFFTHSDHRALRWWFPTQSSSSSCETHFPQILSSVNLKFAVSVTIPASSSLLLNIQRINSKQCIQMNNCF